MSCLFMIILVFRIGYSTRTWKSKSNLSLESHEHGHKKARIEHKHYLNEKTDTLFAYDYKNRPKLSGKTEFL